MSESKDKLEKQLIHWAYIKMYSDYGSEEQIEADNKFWKVAEALGFNPDEHEHFLLKSTDKDMVDLVYDKLGIVKKRR